MTGTILTAAKAGLLAALVGALLPAPAGASQTTTCVPAKPVTHGRISGWHIRTGAVSESGQLTLRGGDGRHPAKITAVSSRRRNLPLTPRRAAVARRVAIKAAGTGANPLKLTAALTRGKRRGVVHVRLSLTCTSATQSQAASSSAAVTSQQPAVSRQPVQAPAGNAGNPLGVTNAFGFNQNYSPTDFPAAPAKAAAAGANVGRVSLAWWAIEATKGRYDWTYYDSVYQRLQASGLRPLWVVTGAPCWAHPSTACSAWQIWAPEPAYDSSWQQFMSALAKRYPNSAGIEVWNEANLDTDYWHAIAPARYVQLLGEAFQSIRAANRNMPVLATSLVRLVGADNPEGYDWQTYLNAEYDANPQVMLHESDAIAVHPYPWNSPALTDMLTVMDATRQIMASHGDGSKPLWITEVGESDQGWPGASPRQQASDLTAIISAWRAHTGSMANVPALLIHELYDDASAPGFGVIGLDGTPKPAYCAIAKTMGRPAPAGCSS